MPGSTLPSADVPVHILGESVMRFSQAARLAPFLARDGSPGHVSKVHRAHCPGIRGIRLEAVRTPGGWLTSHEAITRFVVRLSGGNPDPHMRPEKRREADQRRAEAVLEAAGI